MFRPEIVVVDRVKWDGESNVDFVWNKCTHWGGAKRKDFWNPESNWEGRIQRGSRLRVWTICASAVVGFQLEEDGQWVDVWCTINDFETKEEREESDNMYFKFIEEEGKYIANMIDLGMSYNEIDKNTSEEHTGNTFGWAMSIGTHDAKDQENAKKVRIAHNKKYGVEDDGGDGVVNPAVLRIQCGD